MLFGGIFHDTIFNGKVFFTIAVISVFHVEWLIVLMVPFVPYKGEVFGTWNLFIYGFFIAFTEFIIRVLVPLKVASQNRTTYELTMAGTIVAVFNLIFWFINQCLVSVGEKTISLRAKWTIIIYRLIGTLLCLITALIVRKRAVKEYRELKVLCKQSKWNFCCCKKRPKPNEIVVVDEKNSNVMLSEGTDANSSLA